MTLSNTDSYSSLHQFLTVIMSFLRKEQQFADKDIQNIIFATLQKTASLRYVSDLHDFTDAINALYDLITKILYFRNQEDDKKLSDFISSLVDCVSRSKQISFEESVNDILLFLANSLLQTISTDGIPDLDPRGALLLLKLAGVLPASFKFSSSVGRGKISKNTTFDSGNTWLYIELEDRPMLTYENIDQASLFLQQATFSEQDILDRQDRFLRSSRLVIDHHHRYCQSTSITHMVYVLLIALQRLPSTDLALQRFVAFIDMSDDMYYQLATMDDRISLCALVGIQRELLYNKLIDIDDLYTLFSTHPSLSGLEMLDDGQLDILSHGQLPLCKKAIEAKSEQLQSGTTQFLALKDDHTFFHLDYPFLWLINETIPRVLDVTTKYGYGLLQLNKKTGEIKIHNALGFDDAFLAGLTHPAIKVMKGRNIFIKANEQIPDSVIESSLVALGCPLLVVKKMISVRTETIRNAKRY